MILQPAMSFVNKLDNIGAFQQGTAPMAWFVGRETAMEWFLGGMQASVPLVSSRCCRAILTAVQNLVPIMARDSALRLRHELSRMLRVTSDTVLPRK